MLSSTDCGSSGSQNNPPLPKVVIETNGRFQDVGGRFVLDASKSTDPNGDSANLTFAWRFTQSGPETDFQDHCRDNFDEICTHNDNDHCTNDENRFCTEDADCINFGTCKLNSGTSSSECSTGICGVGEGDQGTVATFVADVSGPFTIRCTADGAKSNGTRTITVDTYPSLYLVGSLLQFGGTGGADLGAVADADQYAAEAIQGASDPGTGNLVIIDDALHLVRVFDITTGLVVGPFGESDRFINDPAALTFNPTNNRLFVAEASGRVLMFDDTTGLLISTFGNVGANPVAIHFSPTTGNLLVAYGTPGSGVREFDITDGSDLGVLGNTASAVDTPVDIDFTREDSPKLLVADAAGNVIRCNANGTSCGTFSAEADSMLADGSPSAIAVNPSSDFTDNQVMIADPVGKRVIACTSDGADCSVFGATDDQDSAYRDVFFAPNVAPTTTTSTSTTTSTTLK